MDIGLSKLTHTPGESAGMGAATTSEAEDLTVETPMTGWSLDRTPMQRRGRPDEVAAAVRLQISIPLCVHEADCL